MSFLNDRTSHSHPFFNSDGNLILPSGAVEEFRKERKAIRRMYTGKKATCPKCGHEWKICEGKKNVRRCHLCGARVNVGILESESEPGNVVRTEKHYLDQKGVTLWDILHNSEIRSLPREISRLEKKIEVHKWEQKTVEMELKAAKDPIGVYSAKRRLDTIARRIGLDSEKLEQLKAEREKALNTMDTALDGGH